MQLPVVVEANTVVHPGAVMVHVQDASSEHARWMDGWIDEQTRRYSSSGWVEASTCGQQLIHSYITKVAPAVMRSGRLDGRACVAVLVADEWS